LVVIAAALDDPTAIALTAVAAVVATGAVIVYLRESEADKERIAHLQAAIPNFTAPLDADAAVNVAPKPSPIVAEVLRQLRPVVPSEVVAPRPIPPVVPIDRS
jgi:hypothetical protein